MKVSLSKALKLKNRLVGIMQIIKADIEKYNSVPTGGDKVVDVEKQLTNLAMKFEDLIGLKTAISAANGPIQEKIIRMGELKSIIGFYNGIDVRRGVVVEGFRDEQVVYEVVLDHVERALRVEQVQSKIDSLQDELDEFNANTKIEINLSV